ncbi:MAG: BglG family transcription antiterminator [Ancalomicrobiaceae bacterium]|nr:BglG family transcription antiterminator [Ancalomicrobiaceae bacterium]
MNYREREILFATLSEGSVNNITDLASRFGVSLRTVRNDINSINYFLEGINGGRLDVEEKGTIKSQVKTDISYISSIQADHHAYREKLSSDERLSLLSIILSVSADYITIAQLAAMIRVSKATIVKDIKQVRETLQSRGIQLLARPNKGFQVAGLESAIRRLIMDEQRTVVITRFLEELYPSFKAIRSKQRTLIGRIVTEQEHVHGFFLTDYSYEYVILYVQVMMWRIADGCHIDNLMPECNEFTTFADDITKYVSQYCNIITTTNESIILSSVLSELSYLKKSERNYEIVNIQIVTRRFIGKVSQNLGDDLQVDYDLFDSLYHHLAAVLSGEKKSFLSGSILFEIAKQYPLVFRAVANSQYVLEDYARRGLSDVEIAFVTMHICAALERKKNGENEVRVVLVCHGGIGSSQLLAAKLKNRFSFRIVDVLSAHKVQYINKDRADLIISTIPLESPPIDYVQTSLFLNDRDCIAINDKIEHVKYANTGVRNVHKDEEICFINRLKSIIGNYDFPGSQEMVRQVEDAAIKFFDKTVNAKECTLSPYLHQFLTEPFIRLDLSCADWQTAVRESASILLEKGYITERYVDAMINNVIVNGPYIIISPDFAMPHAGLGAGALRTGMSLIRLKHPIAFGQEKSTEVGFVCCLSAVDYRTHVKALINLVNILASDTFKSDLGSAETPASAARVIREAEYALEEQGLGYRIMENDFSHL